MVQYCEIAIGSTSNRYHFIRVDQLAEKMRKARADNTALYRSYFYFDESVLDHLRTRKTTSTFKGNFYLPYLLFDIDKGTDVGDFVHERCIAFVENLIGNWKIPKESITIYFSGTGYHVVTPDFFGFAPSADLPRTVKDTLARHFKIDTSFLNPRGLIRIPYTINQKSDLYKIPVDYDSMVYSSYSDICAKAKECPDDMIKPLKLSMANIPDYSMLKVQSNNKLTSINTDIQVSDRNNPTRIITCGQKIYDGGANEGQRHLKILRLVSIWRRQGLNYMATLALIKHWCFSLEETEIEKQVSYAWDKGYTYGCKDKLLSEFCDSNCIYYSHKNYGSEILSMDQVEKLYIEKVKNMDLQNTVNLQSVFPTLKNSFRINPQETCVVQGDTGLGKTAFVQTIAVFHPHLKILYLTFEVSAQLLFRRFIQISQQMSKDKVEEYYREHGEISSLSSNIKHIKVVQTMIDMTEIRKHIAHINANLVIIDVLDGIKTQNPELVAKTEMLANELQDMVKEMNIMAIIVHHISKQAALLGSLSVHSGKGSSAVPQKADIVISIEGDPKKNERIVRSNKARDQDPFNVILSHNFETMSYEII